MSRNLLSRVETGFPILDDACFQQVFTEGLAIYLEDTQAAWELQPDGHYRLHELQEDEVPFNSQLSLIEKYSLDTD